MRGSDGKGWNAFHWFPFHPFFFDKTFHPFFKYPNNGIHLMKSNDIHYYLFEDNPNIHLMKAMKSNRIRLRFFTI